MEGNWGNPSGDHSVGKGMSMGYSGEGEEALQMKMTGWKDRCGSDPDGS